MIRAALKLALLTIVLTCAALGCLSTPNTRYYTLDMTPSGGAEPGVHLQIVRVQTLESLARSEILIQTSPTRIEYYAEDAWSASLQELIAEKVAAELGEKQDGQETFDLGLKMGAFQQVDTPNGAEAWVKLTAEVREPGASLYAAPLFERTYDVRVSAASPEPNAIVLALSSALEQIAAQIAQDTRGLKLPEE